MPTIRLTLEYDGTNFVGWQYQTNGRSVQDELEKAIKQILQIDVRVVGGGRTDAGVHARGQVASFRIEQKVEVNSLARSINAVLPHDVVVREAQVVPSDFNARYSAKFRWYKYYVNQEPTAIMRNYCWQVFYKLNLDLMQRCAAIVLGEHDFRSFCKAAAAVQRCQCIIKTAEWAQKNETLEFNIIANRFLHGMIRSLVGTMVDVGRGYTSIEEFNTILESNDRKATGMSAPASGLILEGVIY